MSSPLTIEFFSDGYTSSIKFNFTNLSYFSTSDHYDLWVVSDYNSPWCFQEEWRKSYKNTAHFGTEKREILAFRKKSIGLLKLILKSLVSWIPPELLHSLFINRPVYFSIQFCITMCFLCALERTEEKYFHLVKWENDSMSLKVNSNPHMGLQITLCKLLIIYFLQLKSAPHISTHYVHSF